MQRMTVIAIGTIGKKYIACLVGEHTLDKSIIAEILPDPKEWDITETMLGCMTSGDIIYVDQQFVLKGKP